MDINKIHNANVYVDGSLNLLGRAAEVTLPEITAATEEHQALGMIGKVVLPTGLDLLEAKLKWNTFYPEVLTLGADPFTSHKIQVRASVETFGAAGRVAEKPLVVLMTCRWKKTPLGVFAPQTNPEYEQELSCTYVKVTLDGTELVEVDVQENVWRVNGVDILARYRANLGG